MPEVLASEELAALLDQPQRAQSWLQTLGVENSFSAHASLVGLAEAGMTLDLVGEVASQLAVHLPETADPDMALANLQRFVAASRNPIALGSLFERDREALPVLLQILAASQHLADGLIRDPDGFDLLRITDGQPVAREMLIEEIVEEIGRLEGDAAVMAALRRWKRRETLRIAYGDIVRGQPLDTVTAQISHIADALCEAALQAAMLKYHGSRGRPKLPDGRDCRFVILALGKLGGQELNYSSDIDLMFLYEGDGTTEGPRRIENAEFFDRVARHAVKLLTESTADGAVYRVDLRLRPSGSSGPMVISKPAAQQYYDTRGRTWERQAFVKARAIAGDIQFGEGFLADLQPWIYRRYLGSADIGEIKALKRRIEHRSAEQHGPTRNVKTGHGGIRDIEFSIQFLQLLNGGDLPHIREGNTLTAIMALERDGCLTYQERTILEENYAFLRKIEHRLQIMFDLQTHALPDQAADRQKLARRMRFQDEAGETALAQFDAEYAQRTAENRKILDHLLHEAFGDDGAADPVVDLVLHPSPAESEIDRVLSQYRFADVTEAYRNLMALADEQVRFLSSRRCRHFLASIAPPLLQAIDNTPAPDTTLANLVRVSESLGGKAALWELFSNHPPSLDLYVRICGASNYLCDILTTNPGMIDELLDSLMLDRLPTQEYLRLALADLSRGAEDLTPILGNFKNSQHLAVGVRDILGRETIQSTHAALADIAEVVLEAVAAREFELLVQRLGRPTIGEGPRQGDPCELIILALGKVGGREPNYHSDLDIVFLYEADGATQHDGNGRAGATSTSNSHFFNELAQRIIKAIDQRGPSGRLYEIDPRLRPTGRNGALAISLDELRRYHTTKSQGGQAEVWERQVLCKARPVFGSPSAREAVEATIREIVCANPWQPGHADEIRQMRLRLQADASERNLKRAPGGTMDVEFIVQMLQLKHAAKTPQVLAPGTLDALAALVECSAVSGEDGEFLANSYRSLRSVESRLRLMNAVARHDLPSDRDELNRLAWLSGHSSGEALENDCLRLLKQNRVRFERIFAQA